MTATYKEFTGEVISLKRREASYLNGGGPQYDLELYDRQNDCIHTFSSIKLEDVKFSGFAATFS